MILLNYSIFFCNKKKKSCIIFIIFIIFLQSAYLKQNKFNTRIIEAIHVLKNHKRVYIYKKYVNYIFIVFTCIHVYTV